MGMEDGSKDFDAINWPSQLAHDQWVLLPLSGHHPAARYKHAAAVVDEKLYIVGGSRNGRHLSSIEVLDLKNLAWSPLKLSMEPKGDKLEDNGSKDVFPGISGHSMVKWGNKLLILGGHSRISSEYLTVHYIDLETHGCGILETSGKVPVARGGHSVTLVGSRLIVFGGEQASRRLLNDVHALDLDTMTWELLEVTRTPPAPRFDHTSAVHAERYLVVFGGSSHSTCFNDLHVLDLHSLEWSEPQIQGDVVAPRAGHAGVNIDGYWYIVGGGDNRSGASETLVLDLSRLSWSVLTTVKEREPIASEGVSVCSALMGGETHLIAFGGYNGKYNNEVFVMKPNPRGSVQPKIFQSPAAAAAAASVTAAYALAKSGALDFTITEDPKGNEVEDPQQKLENEIAAVKQEKKVLEAALAEIEAENSGLRDKIDECNNTHTELSKEHLSVQGQLVAERSRCFKLEAQITELQKILESLQTLENEVEKLRAFKSAMEEEDRHLAAEGQRQSSGGLWQWIAGGNRDS
ncbi:hypothetical protein RJ641_036359 [Dillenia turbinata]|uniref:Acyl-CoA-binding domain-containing protein n=1 Tax=Dillenia turbinata TaxID=194707 RepID=A0AAN8ZGC2_9MAGN